MNHDTIQGAFPARAVLYIQSIEQRLDSPSYNIGLESSIITHRIWCICDTSSLLPALIALLQVRGLRTGRDRFILGDHERARDPVDLNKQ